MFFFFQAEDGIRDTSVTGVQTCALPISIDPKETRARLELAAVLENNGDWVDALDQYRQAALADSSDNTQNQYKAAQERLDRRIASMRAAGNTAQAASLKTSLRTMNVTPGISDKLNSAMQAGVKANAERRFDEAEKHYKYAVELAEKLQPHDGRFTTSLLHLADLYAGRRDFVQAEVTYQRGLKATEELYGPQSPMMTEPLQALGRYALLQRDYNAALDFYSRAVDVNEKAFGENSDKVAASLVYLAVVPFMLQAYDKAETYLLRASRNPGRHCSPVAEAHSGLE